MSHAPAATSPVPLVGGVPEVGHASSPAILGDRKRREVWQVPAHHAAFTLMGSITLDLREAVLTARETTINANAIMGEIEIIIAAHMHTVVDGTPIMGDYGQGKDKVPADFRPDSPTSDSRESAGHSASAAIDALTIRAGLGLATCRDPGVARRAVPSEEPHPLNSYRSEARTHPREHIS